MKVEEFVALTKSFKKAQNRFYIIQIFVLFAGIAAFFPLVDFLEPKFIDNHKAFNLIFIILLFSFLIGNLIITFVFAFRQPRIMGLVCPECNGSFQVNLLPIVISTRNCPHCGKTILEE